jgi:chemotaxis receptor (MCP) glutamine deamidase CheD|tara:strand:- start:532 stop:816 length:285 start_codon:yes stop_codon:yes gene_type:complete
MIKKKYKKENSELIKSLQDMGRDIAMLEIKLVGTSKVKDNLIYECTYTDKGDIKNVPVIAQDVTQALAKLEQFTHSGIPEPVLQYMLGSERFSN